MMNKLEGNKLNFERVLLYYEIFSKSIKVRLFKMD
jgi:hypothetical protein